MPDVRVTVIGGGVVGLAIAAALARTHRPLVLLERHPRCGQETSSRNSEVIHAGIYYEPGSLKARLCVEGRERMYELCMRHGVPHNRIGKIITAAFPGELPSLDALYARGTANGVPLEMLTAAQVHAMEPNVRSVAGMFSPATGIVNAHGLMDCFHRLALDDGAIIQTRCEVAGIRREAGSYTLTMKEGQSPLGGTAVTTLSSELVVNAAGLDADSVASLAGIDVEEAGYRLRWVKGSYFALPGSMRGLVSRLVYPVPHDESLGVHVVVGLNGAVKFGPDVEYLSERRKDYAVDEARKHAFAEAARRILPAVRDEDLSPDMAGIRPKLQVHGGPAKDFIIREESDRGLPGFVNLIGIDSPGLTASPAIARHVAGLLA
jgi:L-2-hydroxyglutarate oxidase LhgO